jgi:Holliday junction resolvasome RuvABC ATP-dependent DNA helicase subunit
MSEQLLVYRTLIAAFVGRFVDLADDERGQTVDHIVWTGIALLGAAVVAAIIWNKLKTGANDIQVPAPAAP